MKLKLPKLANLSRFLTAIVVDRLFEEPGLNQSGLVNHLILQDIKRVECNI
jgi:hypothetical protein